MADAHFSFSFAGRAFTQPYLLVQRLLLVVEFTRISQLHFRHRKAEAPLITTSFRLILL